MPKRSPYFLFLLLMNPSLLMAQLPPGAVAKYPMDNNSAADVSGNGYNGTLTGTSATANRFGTSNRAVAFVAGTSTGSLPSGLVSAVANDFTIAYWFKTTMTAPSASDWYNGTALVDAEVCNSVNDFGTALINGGSVAMGIGNPDITIVSPGTTYNNGAWHFVTAVRSEAAGVITLYIDGTQVATTSGTSTAPRTAPPAIGLADNNCQTTGVYTGSLDDIIAYGSALTSAQVTQLYNYSNTTPLPLDWLSFTAQAAGSGVYLQWSTDHSVDNSFFDVGRSTDGTNFSVIGQVSNLDSGGNAIGTTAYHYTDANPPQGKVFYRIMEVDKDGQESWSSISEVTIGKVLTGIRLQNNPVTDQVTVMNSGQILLQRMQVLDVAGRVLIDQAPNSSDWVLQLNTSSLPSGYYLLRVGGSGTTTIIPFVKL